MVRISGDGSGWKQIWIWNIDQNLILDSLIMAVYSVLFYKLYTILRLNDIGDMGIFFDTWNSSKIVSKTE